MNATPKTETAAYRWTPQNALTRREKILLWTAIFSVLIYFSILGIALLNGKQPSEYNLLWVLLLYFSCARLWDWWPFTAGNFIYFRDGQLLYRVGVTSLFLSQGTVVFCEIESVFLEPHGITIRTALRKFRISSIAVPPIVWKKVLIQFFSELKPYENVRVTKVIDEQ